MSMSDPAEPGSAAEAFASVLQHPDVANDMDERLFEALFAHALNVVPGLAPAVFGCDPRMTFKLGSRGVQADVLGWLDGALVLQCEVKLRANLNWQEGYGGWQIDRYADESPETDCFLLLGATGRNKLKPKLEAGYEYPIRSIDRWNMLDVEKMTKKALPVLDGARSRSPEISRLALALARLTDKPEPIDAPLTPTAAPTSPVVG